jgi:hypothetical protein
MPLSRIVLWVTTLAGLGLLSRAWLVEPVPGVWLLATCGVLLVLVLLGIALPRWEMFADLLWRGSVDSGAVSMTFLGLPQAERRQELLAALERAGIVATFFIRADEIDRCEASTQLAAAGHRFGLSLETGQASAKSLATHADQLRRVLVDEPQAVLPALRPVSRWSAARAKGIARTLSMSLVGASLGWPEPLRPPFETATLQPGDLICLDAASADAPALEVLAELAVQSGLSWIALEHWLDSERAR